MNAETDKTTSQQHQAKKINVATVTAFTAVISLLITFIALFNDPNSTIGSTIKTKPQFEFKPYTVGLAKAICIQPINEEATNFDDTLYMSFEGVPVKVGKLQQSNTPIAGTFCRDKFWQFTIPADFKNLLTSSKKIYQLAFYFDEDNKSNLYGININTQSHNVRVNLDPAQNKPQNPEQLTAQLAADVQTPYNQGVGEVNIDIYYLQHNKHIPANATAAKNSTNNYRSVNLKLDDIERINPNDKRYKQNYIKLVITDSSKHQSSLTFTYANLINGIHHEFGRNQADGNTQITSISTVTTESTQNLHSPNTPAKPIVELNLVQYTKVKYQNEQQSPIKLTIAPKVKGYLLSWQITDNTINDGRPVTILRNGFPVGVSTNNEYFDEVSTEQTIINYQANTKNNDLRLIPSNVIMDIPNLVQENAIDSFLELSLEAVEHKKSAVAMLQEDTLNFCGAIFNSAGAIRYDLPAQFRATRLFAQTLNFKKLFKVVTPNWQEKLLNLSCQSIPEVDDFIGRPRQAVASIKEICCGTDDIYPPLANLIAHFNTNQPEYTATTLKTLQENNFWGLDAKTVAALTKLYQGKTERQNSSHNTITTQCGQNEPDYCIDLPPSDGQ